MELARRMKLPIVELERGGLDKGRFRKDGLEESGVVVCVEGWNGVGSRGTMWES